MALGADFKHPADEIAQALARANGILTVIGGCYDRTKAEFAVPTSYVAESITAVDSLLSSAALSLGKLYQTCDLIITREDSGEVFPVDVEPDASSESAPIEDAQNHTQAEEAKPAFAKIVEQVQHPKTGYLAAFGPTELSSSLLERANYSIPSFSPSVLTKREQGLDKPATTYEELLAKVTAVADQAAFQAHASPSERSLLPALEGLRADLLKMRAVA